MIVRIVCIALLALALILSLFVWRGFCVCPVMFLRPAGLTDDGAAAAIAVAEAGREIMGSLANSFVWLCFIFFAGGIFRQFVAWDQVCGVEERVSGVVLAFSVILVLTVAVVNGFAYSGPLYLWLCLIFPAILSLMCIVLLYFNERFRGWVGCC